MKNSSEKFFNKICLEMYDDITKFVKYYVRDERITDDIIQETFLEAYRHIDELKKHPNYKGWLYNTAKFKAKHLRSVQYKRDISQTELDDMDALNYGAYYDRHENLFFEELRKKLLPSEYRLIMLKYHYGYTYEEISQKEGITVGACKMRIKRSLKKLRDF